MTIIDELSYALAKKHQEIIDLEIKKCLDLHNIGKEKLIIYYLNDGSIEILIKASHFKIDNNFVVREKDLIK